MKRCLSCSRQVDDSAAACPHCGHRFGAVGHKSTMLGLPALDEDARGDDDDDIFGLGSGSKATQFGLPAQSRDDHSEPSEPEWDDDEDEYDATSIVPTAQLDAQMEFDADWANDASSGPQSRDTAAGIPGASSTQRTNALGSPASIDSRATTAGIPAASRDDDTGNAHPRTVNSAWGLDDESSGPQTAVASGDIVQAADVSGGFAQFNPPADSEHNVGTLLGMSLEELEEKQKAGNQTQFALPAAQREPAPGPDDSADRTAVADADLIQSAVQGLDEESEDSPTMAWNPAEDPEFEAKFGDDARKSKLEKLRAKKHLLKTDRDTAQGIPSAKKQQVNTAQTATDPRQAGPPAAEAPPTDDLRTSSISAEQLSKLSEKVSVGQPPTPESPALKNRGVETPSSGVLKVPKRTNPPGSLRADDTGLLGKSSYKKTRDEITSDQPSVDAKVPVTDGPQAGEVPPKPLSSSAVDTLPDAPVPEPPPPSGGLEEISWKEEFAYDETGIAPAEYRPQDGPVSPTPSTNTAPSAGAPSASSPGSPPSEPGPLGLRESEPDPSDFKASNSEVRPFASSSTGTKFPTGGADEASYPAQRNTMDSSLPSSDGFQPQSGSFQAQQQKKGLAGMSPTDLFSNLPDSVNTAPPGAAPPPSGPRTGAMAPGEGISNFDFSAPSPPPAAFGQTPAQTPYQADPSGVMQQPQHLAQPQAATDGVTVFVGRAQSAFGILGGLVLLASVYFALQPFRVPEQDALAIAMAMTLLSGVGSIGLSLFPVSPGLRGIAFALLSAAAAGALGLVFLAGATSNIIVVVLLLAGAGLTFVAAIFPLIGKFVS